MENQATPQFKFTFRQREFARRYASGAPAAEAARAAGYAASTAETNAARLLSHPRVAAFIERHRTTRLVVSVEDISLCVDKLREIILTDQDPDRIIKATRQMARFLLSQQKEGISPVDNIVSRIGDIDNSHDNFGTQSAVNQRNDDPDFFDDDDPEYFREIDTLPSGESAFDLRVLPRKPEDSQRHEPVTIEFYPVGAPAAEEPIVWPAPDTQKPADTISVTPWEDPEEKRNRELAERRKQRNALGKGRPKNKG